MLDQNIIPLLSTLLGGLLTILGGFVGSYYIQSSSNKTSKRKEIRNIIESIYKDAQKIERKYRFIDANFHDKDTRGKVYDALYETEEILDHMELLVGLYLTPLRKDFAEYSTRMLEYRRKSVANIEKPTEALKENNNVDPPSLEFSDTQFRSSLRRLLKEEGYSYF